MFSCGTISFVLGLRAIKLITARLSLCALASFVNFNVYTNGTLFLKVTTFDRYGFTLLNA